jgi:peptide/nickel transport system substrate-binding protein
MNWKKILSVLIILAASIGLTTDLSFAANPKYGGILVVGDPEDPTGLDPITARGRASFQPIAQIYNGLTRNKEGTFETEPGLAESWEISSDGLTYTFRLRKNVMFQDGTPFDAEALFFNIDRILNKQNPYHPGAGLGQIPIIYGEVKDYKVIDKYTFQFNLKNPYAPFLACLSMAPASIVSPEAVKKYEKDFFKNPVGTGPFIFKEWVKGDHLTLVANEKYWGGRPYVDSLVYRVIPESSVRLLKLEKGEVHLLSSIFPDDIPRIKQNKDLKFYETPGMLFTGISVNHVRKPFDDPRVRKALAYAIDKKEICKSVMKVGVPSSSPLPKSNWGYSSKPEGYSYDPKKAKELLTEAGYPNGFEAEITVRPGAMISNPAGIPLWEAIQSNWNKIGVRIKIRILEMGAYYGVLLSGKNEWEISEGGWNADNGDPDAFLQQRFHSKSWLNYFNYKNPKVDELVMEARQFTDQKKRTPIYEQVQRIIVDEDCAEIAVCDLQLIWASRKELNNFNPKLKTYERLDKVWLD